MRSTASGSSLNAPVGDAQDAVVRPAAGSRRGSRSRSKAPDVVVEGAAVELDHEPRVGATTASTSKPADDPRSRPAEASRRGGMTIEEPALELGARVGEPGGTSASARPSGRSPRRPGLRAITSSTARRSNSLRRSAASIARVTSRGGTTSARSSSVRATVVIGMPSSAAPVLRVEAAGPMHLDARPVSAAGGRVPSRLLTNRELGRRPHECSGAPVAEHGAWPARENRRHPAAVRPRRAGGRRRTRPRASDAGAPPGSRCCTPKPLTPSASSCRWATTPCCRPASAAISRSRGLLRGRISPGK